MNIFKNIKIILLSLLFTINSVSMAVSKVSVDSCNRSVSFDTPPKRAISNDVNLTEMMLVLGLAESMV